MVKLAHVHEGELRGSQYLLCLSGEGRRAEKMQFCFEACRE